MPDGDRTEDTGGRDPTFIERARRAQIVRAGIETIADVGYANASFARIAERAGISPGLISYHFRSKDRLIAQIVTDIEAAMDRAITTEIGTPESFAAALRGLIETQVRYFGQHPEEVTALGEIHVNAQPETPAARITTEQRRSTLHDLETMFREGQREGEWAAFDPRAMAVTLLAALEAVPRELAMRPETDVDDYARHLADIFDLATQRRRRRR